MPNQYTITVENNSGQFRQYVLFSEVPEVTPAVSEKIWSNVLAVAHAAPGQTSTFTIYKQYFAIVGNSSGSPSQGVEVNVGGYKNVEMGATSPTGELVKGTSLELDAKSGAPFFTKTVLPAGGYVNAFEIKPPMAGSSFTNDDAAEGNYMVGVGSAIGGSKGPAATFVPLPNVTYQIKPKNKYYISFGEFTPGQLIDVTMKAAGTAVADFSEQGSPPKVKINNDDRNQLIVQNA